MEDTLIKINFDDTCDNGVELHGRGELLAQLGAFWWHFSKGVLGHPMVYQKESSIVIEKPSEVYSTEFMVIGHLHGELYQMYKENGHLFDYQFPETVKENGVIPGKSGQMNPIMIGIENGKYLTIKDLQEMYSVEELTKIVMAGIHAYQRAYFYLLNFGFILADGLMKFGKNSDGELIFASTLFSPESSCFFNARTFKLGKKCQRLDSSLIKPGIKGNERKLARRKYMSHKEYISQK